jgi:hypothetical protein
MMEFFMGLIGNLFGIASFQLATHQAKSEVISSLKNAIRLTEKHIEDTRKGKFGKKGFQDVESKELSGAWSRVAQAIRPFDRVIARTFEDKSDYWINPHGFWQDIQNGDRSYDYGFRLKEVKNELERIENGRF